MDITIVIPYHNRREFLPTTLGSLAAQPFRPLRLVLVNDGSTDGAEEVCANFRERHAAPDFTIKLIDRPHGGATHARNAGLQAAETTWVYFFDSDDEFSPDFFSALRPVCESSCPPDIVAFDTAMVFPCGRRVVRASLHTASAADQILSGHIPTQGMVLRTDFLRQAGGWDERVFKWDDWELALRLLLSGARVAWIKGRAFHRVYRHADSISGADFSSTYHRLLPAMERAAADIRSVRPLPGTDDDTPWPQNRDSRRAALLALSLRAAIVAGQLLREGDRTHAAEMRGKSAALRREATGGCFAALAAAFCTRYTALGGRGAWRLALGTLRCMRLMGRLNQGSSVIC